jgi:hypothetical protein
MANSKGQKLKRGVCVGCGCTHSTPCTNAYHDRTCSWVDKGQTVCSACFGRIGFSSAEDNIKAIRTETRISFLRRCLDLFTGDLKSAKYTLKSTTRARAVETRLRVLAKGSLPGGLRMARGGA